MDRVVGDWTIVLYRMCCVNCIYAKSTDWYSHCDWSSLCAEAPIITSQNSSNHYSLCKILPVSIYSLPMPWKRFPHHVWYFKPTFTSAQALPSLLLLSVICKANITNTAIYKVAIKAFKGNWISQLGSVSELFWTEWQAIQHFLQRFIHSSSAVQAPQQMASTSLESEFVFIYQFGGGG